MQKTLALLLLMMAVSISCWADPGVIPEIDPASGASALALLTGAMLVIRGRKK
jgi:hypothetical protein